MIRLVFDLFLRRGEKVQVPATRQHKSANFYACGTFCLRVSPQPWRESFKGKEVAMGRGFPSMTALLGLLAIAGYQNRDKLAEMLRGTQNRTGTTGQSGTGGLLGQLGDSLGSAGVGGLLSGGLAELVDRFRQSGQGETVDSWVAAGPNKQIAPSQLEQAIGPDVLETLSKQTGISREEILVRLSRELPNAVDKYTPEGRLPTAA
jgi:uncharacterized protein YidB (DUF937 family)